MIASPKDNSAQAERIRKLFTEWIEPGEHTRLFDRFPPDQQERFSMLAGLAPDEQPLVACALHDDCWTLLTTERLIWRLAGRQTALGWAELADVQLLHRMNPLRPSGSGVTTSTLQVVTDGGRVHAIELETGPPFFGFWTALKLIINERRRAGGP
jgi:hypothetical protein